MRGQPSRCEEEKWRERESVRGRIKRLRGDRTGGLSLSLSVPALSPYTPRIQKTHVLLQGRALLAVVCVRHTGPTAHAAPPRRRAVVALITDADDRRGAYERVAHHALAAAPLADAADGWWCVGVCGKSARACK